MGIQSLHLGLALANEFDLSIEIRPTHGSSAKLLLGQNNVECMLCGCNGVLLGASLEEA